MTNDYKKVINKYIYECIPILIKNYIIL